MKKRARAVSYFLSVAAIAAIFFSIEHFAEKFFFRDYDLVDITAAIVAAVSFSECRRFFDRATDRIFSRGPRDASAEFITDISHELQTPIAILRGNVELLQRRSITETERACAERVIVATLDGMSRLIGGILESAKLKFSKQSLCGEYIPVVPLLWEIREDCRLLAEDRGVRLSVDGDADRAAPGAAVRGDRGKLKEVLFNLISNALKHTPRGGSIVLRMDRIGSVPHADALVRIAVEDSGRGISSEALPHIFERFYCIKHQNIAFADGDAPAPADMPPGNGIGLNICREIIEAHKGTIVAESEPGKGSRFIISLPPSPSIGAPAVPCASVIINQ